MQFLHGITYWRLKALKSHYSEGLTPKVQTIDAIKLISTITITRVHGNKRHTPRHAITHNDTEKIVSFIKNFQETHGILLPGRVPGVRDYEKAKLLSSSMSKRYVYSMYRVM